MYEVQNKPFVMQPRERLERYGADQLSEQELLAILLRTGSKVEPVLELAGRILNEFGNLANFREAALPELQAIAGIGPVKSVELKAMIELGHRIHNASRPYSGDILSSEDFGQQMIDELAGFTQEHLIAIYLDNRNQIILQKTIFIGSINSAPATPREILYYAVKNLTAKIIVVHNHPTGNTEPSRADREFTKKLAKSCDSIGIILLDHLIVGQDHYFSFREKDLLI